MGWLAKLFRQKSYTPVDSVAEITGGRIEITGQVEALESVVCPLSGVLAVAVHYRAHAPGIAARAYGGMTGGALDVSIECREARDFLLRDATGAILVLVPHGQSVGWVHADQSEKHGLDLHAETSLVSPGQRIRIRGKIVQQVDSSPHRGEPYTSVMRAESIEAS